MIWNILQVRISRFFRKWIAHSSRIVVSRWTFNDFLAVGDFLIVTTVFLYIFISRYCFVVWIKWASFLTIQHPPPRIWWILCQSHSSPVRFGCIIVFVGLVNSYWVENDCHSMNNEISFMEFSVERWVLLLQVYYIWNLNR